MPARGDVWERLANTITPRALDARRAPRHREQVGHRLRPNRLERRNQRAPDAIAGKSFAGIAFVFTERDRVVIVDHGNRYWSVYGHLDELHVDVGRKVAAGDSLGTAGVSGGRKDPGLYFQVRYATRADQSFNPVDPRPWFRTPAPPAR
jgi:murein DD-endopeptidase MepM/ murein hydrolase activator NlpD